MPSALILYQYFHPDDVVSSVHVTELAEGLAARGWKVTAAPCNRSCRTNEAHPPAGSRSGVQIKRIWRPPLQQDKSWGRIANCLWMLAAWSLKALTTKADVIIIGTDPILSAVVAIPWKFLQPNVQTVHWCFDLYPEAALADGILSPGIALNAIRRIMSCAYKRIDVIADIGDCMRQRLSAYSTNAVPSRLWPWALVEPVAIPDTDPTHRKQVFGDTQLAIMYSGNFGRAHSFSELLNIARQMRDAPVHFSFGIRGNRVAEVKNAVTAADSNISFAPFAPADQLEARLSAADIHVVSLRLEWTGTVVPSKFFGALAAGRPVLFIGSEDCCIAQLIRRHALGWVCAPGREHEVAQELRDVANNTESLRSIQERCHHVYRKHFSQETALTCLDENLRGILERSENQKSKSTRSEHQTSAPTPNQSKPLPRWLALDALRGLAALSVAWFHFYNFSALPTLLRMPKWTNWILLHGSLGVEVFFVLSGVVISLSIMGDRISLRYALRFAARRSIRLDPPYWATLALACLLMAVIGKPPAPLSVLAHAFYLQNILGLQNIVSQFWTLCYEIQFYLVLILLVGLAQRTGRIVAWAAAIVPLGLSLALNASGHTTHGWFIDWWYAFAIGAATSAMLEKKASLLSWAATTCTVLALGLFTKSDAMICVAATAAAIGCVGRLGKLNSWSGGTILQYLGRISYSLYLMHFLGSNFTKIAAARAHTTLAGAAIFVAATIISIVAADALYRIVEKPAHKLSRRISKPAAPEPTNKGAEQPEAQLTAHAVGRT